MKHYYIKHPRNFDNEYVLYSVQAGSQAEKYLWDHDFERIARRAAEDKVAQERWRKKNDRAVSGYARDYIIPFDEIDERDPCGMRISTYELCRRLDEGEAF